MKTPQQEKQAKWNKAWYERQKKNDPEFLKKHSKRVNAYIKSRYHADPEYRAMNLARQKRYREARKANNGTKA